MTTVVCVYVRGHVPFTVEYVTRLSAMVKRWMDRPYRFVCLTDRPHKMPAGVEAIRIPTPQNMAGWWAKVGLFNPFLDLTGRVLYLDLDTLVVAPLAPILDYPARFALVPHGGAFRPKNGHEIVCKYNSSVMVWNAGEQSEVYSDWTPDIAERYHGDQDWIGLVCPRAATMPAEWFPRLSTIRNGEIPPEAKVILAKVPKNEVAARRWPWFNAIWRAA